MANEKRLIYADELKGIFGFLRKMWSGTEVMAMIDEAPTVDAVEVVRGRWVLGNANHREYMKCSVCLKSQTPTGVFTYCPNCGAKMDGGINNE